MTSVINTFNGLDSNGQEYSFPIKKSRFNLHFNDGRTRVYRRQGERFSDTTVSEYDRFDGGLVVVWAGVTMNQRPRFCIVDGDLNAQRSVDDILQPVVVPFLGRMNQGAVLQDDNALPHRGRVVNEFIRQFNIRRLGWLANSPDLNPMEHIGDELGRRVYRHNPPQTLVQLRQRLIQEWINIHKKQSEDVFRARVSIVKRV